MWTSIATFLGGLGLFLLAVALITDGLKIAAGGALRDILARSTRTRLRGLASGVLVTGLVQSSSAVTVATIGFVNAGLLGMVQALGVVYGANVGTTMTGWLVAGVGFKLDVEAFALPLIGIGMFIRLTGASTRIGAVGEAAAGFGLFFLGVDVLRGAFEGVAATVDVGALAPAGVTGLLLYVVVGFAMTLFTQSSSAAIALTLSAVAGGMIGMNPAAAMVIGANLGTTSTAAFAVIGATSNARRVALAHVLFNAVTGVVALLLLPMLFWVVLVTADVLDLEGSPVMTLALFHTAFNLLGVVLMWPFTPRLAQFLERRFRTRAEDLGRPAHLDPTVTISSELALDALRLELARTAGFVRHYTVSALDAASAVNRVLDDEHGAIRRLVDAVERFVARLESQRIPEGIAKLLALALRISNHVDEIATLTRDYIDRRSDFDTWLDPATRLDVDGFRHQVVAFVERCDPGREDADADRINAQLAELHEQWRFLKARLLESGVRRTIAIERLNEVIDALRRMVHLADRHSRLAIRLIELGLTTPAAQADTNAAA